MTYSSSGTPWQAIRPDANAATLVARSLDRPEAMDQLTEGFVRHLSVLAPSPDLTASLTPPAAQRLLASILVAISGMGDRHDPEAADRAEAELLELGSWMHQAGLDSDGLRGVGYALVRAARDGAGTQWTTSVGSAWAAVQAWLVDQLLAGARRQPTMVTPMTPIPAMPVQPAVAVARPLAHGESMIGTAEPVGLFDRLAAGAFGRRR